jgi:hypothetical protein
VGEELRDVYEPCSHDFAAYKLYIVEGGVFEFYVGEITFLKLAALEVFT